MTLNQSLRGVITVPGDKSISHRSIILGAISNGVTHVYNFLESDDCLTTMQAFKAMGIEITNTKERVTIYGKQINQLNEPQQPLNMGNSGTSTRLISGLLAGEQFQSELFGDASLSKRPMKRIIDPLTEMGGAVT